MVQNVLITFCTLAAKDIGGLDFVLHYFSIKVHDGYFYSLTNFEVNTSLLLVIFNK